MLVKKTISKCLLLATNIGIDKEPDLELTADSGRATASLSVQVCESGKELLMPEEAGFLQKISELGRSFPVPVVLKEVGLVWIPKQFR